MNCECIYEPENSIRSAVFSLVHSEIRMIWAVAIVIDDMDCNAGTLNQLVDLGFLRLVRPS